MNAAVFGMARCSEGGERKAAEARELLDVVVAMAGGGGGGKESNVGGVGGVGWFGVLFSFVGGGVVFPLLPPGRCTLAL